MTQDKKIKLNIAIIIGLVISTLLFAGFTTVAHAQNQKNIQNNNRIFEGQGGTLIIGTPTSGQNYCAVYSSSFDVAGIIGGTVTQGILGQALKVIPTVAGVCSIPANADFLRAGQEYCWVAYAQTQQGLTKFSAEFSCFDVKKEGLFLQAWNGIKTALDWFKSLFKAPPSCEEIKADFENIKSQFAGITSIQDAVKALEDLQKLLSQLQESDCNCGEVIVISDFGATITITIDDLQTIIKSLLKNPRSISVNDLSHGMPLIIDAFISCLEGQIIPPPPSEDCDCFKFVGEGKGNYIKTDGEFIKKAGGDWGTINCNDKEILRDAAGNIIGDKYVEVCPPKLAACIIEEAAAECSGLNEDACNNQKECQWDRKRSQCSGAGGAEIIGVAINELYVANTEGEVFINGISHDTVSVIDTDPASPTYHKVIKTIPVESNPFGVAVDPERRLVYVGSFGTQIYVIDGDPLSPDYHEVIDIIQVLYPVTGVSVNSDLNLVYAVHSNDNSVSVIDQDTNTVISPISPISIGIIPFGFGKMVDTKNNQVYVTNWGTGSGNTVSVIDANNVALFSTTPPVIPIPVGLGPLGVAVDSPNNEVYITNSADNSVSIISTISNAVIDTITNIGTGGPTGVAVDSIKRLAYVTNWDAGAGNTVSVIDINTRAVLKIISNGIGDGPIGVVVDVLHNKIYVTNKEDKVNDPSVTWNVGTVSVIEGDLLSSDYLTVIDIDPTNPSVIDKILVGKSPSGIDILSCVPAEKETVPPSGCSGGQILVGDQCVCPKGTVFDTAIERCTKPTLPPIGIPTLEPIDISGGGVIPIGGDTGGGIIPCPLDDPDC